MIPADAASFLADEAVAALARLRQAWPWLAQARLPGVPSTVALVERHLSPTAEAVEADHVRRDRQAGLLAVRSGVVPTGPIRAPARVGALKARAAIQHDVRRLADRLQDAVGALNVPARRAEACPWCRGQGVALRPADWDPAWHWPDRSPTCSMCGGYRQCCPTCRGYGPCGCDDTDLVVMAALDVTAAALPHLLHPEQAADACRVLERCDKQARRVLGLAEDRRVIKAPCPACDRRGELVAEVTSQNRDEWSVTCVSQLCTCSGPGCGCGRPVRWRGRRHRWPAREFPALAELLGVDLQALGWQRAA